METDERKDDSIVYADLDKSAMSGIFITNIFAGPLMINIFTLTFNPIFSPPLLHIILINPALSSRIKHFYFSDTLQSCCRK